MKQFWFSLFVYAYSAIVFWVIRILNLLAKFSRGRIRDQLEGRTAVKTVASNLLSDRATKEKCVLFFCSSAGEYEQAKPLIDRVSQRSDMFVHIVFFSKSGLDYAASRSEGASCSLVSTDSAWEWGLLFAVLRPSIVAVVRHELWPGFLHTARNYGYLCLIDASASLGEQTSRAKRWIRKNLLEQFNRIFVVSDHDRVWFESRYRIARESLSVVGDTKYDRVKERALQSPGTVRDFFKNEQRPRMVIGSAHPHDLEVVLAARSKSPSAKSWLLVVAPHHVTPDMIERIEGLLSKGGLTHSRYTRGALPQSVDVVIIDTMGMLAEVYGEARAAFIGGAMHHQVHNVLEPACHGLALACGPFYENSAEARKLVEHGLLRVCRNGDDVAHWWSQLGGGDLTKLETDVKVFVEQMTGAADRIFEDWKLRLDV